MGDRGMVAGRGRPLPQRSSGGSGYDPEPDVVQEVRRREFLVGPDTFLSERLTGQELIWLWNAGHRVGWVYRDQVSGRWSLVAFQSCRGWLAGDYAMTVLAGVVAVWGLALADPVPGQGSGRAHRVGRSGSDGNGTAGPGRGSGRIGGRHARG